MSTITTTADQIVRRRVAVEFLGKGMSTADVALVLGVSVSSVKRWKRAFKFGGAAALEPQPHPGPPTKLTPCQRERLRRLLVTGRGQPDSRRSVGPALAWRSWYDGSSA